MLHIGKEFGVEKNCKTQMMRESTRLLAFEIHVCIFLITWSPEKKVQQLQKSWYSFAEPDMYILKSKQSSFSFLFYFRSRPDVQTCTSWKAPIIWDGMFDPDLYDQMHKSEGSSVALTVFAIGRFVFTLIF